ncbi:MAG: 16S rRNA (guanine(966)-N(2))-methyltransferase RsmD [Candidatus Sumerlaeia bacterium]|nr:16S rRNA (guanine(966)-N(2))-methyltransferase RsmD [Candidatus Sumerlaeia bacterium]
MSLRIISGERRGAKLRTPEGLDTRPLRDRVREALFSKIRPRLRNARVLDAFAGSGAVGLEALSNGAAHVIMVEPSKVAGAVLEENIRKLRYESRTTLLRGKSPDVLSSLAADSPPIDLMFLMPPYHSGLCGSVLTAPVLSSRLAPDALAVCEVHHEETFEAPGGWQVSDDRLYGITRLVFLERSSGEAEKS